MTTPKFEGNFCKYVEELLNNDTELEQQVAEEQQRMKEVRSDPLFDEWIWLPPKCWKD